MGTYKLKKGYNLKIKSEVLTSISEIKGSKRYGITVSDFVGIKPKLIVKAGDEVEVGSPLFFNKNNPKVQITSPTSGRVSEIKRGERRSLEEIIIETDGQGKSRIFTKVDTNDLLNTSTEKILGQILDAGLFPFFIQRPYAVVANPDIVPENIFISAYYTAPFSPDINLIVEGNEAEIQAGINALSRLTKGSVHLSLSNNQKASEALEKAQNVQIHYFEGTHPAGNVGIQAHHIQPVNKGETIWTLSLQGVIAIGKLFLEGIYLNKRVITIAGEGVETSAHYKVEYGASIKSLVEDKLVGDEKDYRIIDGDIFSGQAKSSENFFGFYNHIISVIPEIKQKVFMGWLLPSLKKESFSRTFLSWLMPNKKFSHNTGYHGGVRAFVASEQYESVFPMDIYPVHLIKSAMYDDMEEMEKLGILEVAPEDFALCDYVCVSKIEAQYIIRQTLNKFYKETLE